MHWVKIVLKQKAFMLRKILIGILLISPFVSLGQAAPQIIKVGRLKNLIENKTDSIQVINFWATWCAPCVKELPLFEKLHQESKGNVKVTLVSMDLELDPNPEKVFKFVMRKNLTSRVWILDEKDANSWIDKVEAKWTGALPATLVINTMTGKRSFLEGEVSEEKLKTMISEIQ
jgi:thiol-disulfide isomerase/thioredoxin